MKFSPPQIHNKNSKLNFNKNTSIEAQISAISDDIAYNNHDIQDGIKANLFKLEDLIEIKFFKEIYKSYKSNIKKKRKNRKKTPVFRSK